jgi:hypothetical protein
VRRSEGHSPTGTQSESLIERRAAASSGVFLVTLTVFARRFFCYACSQCSSRSAHPNPLKTRTIVSLLPVGATSPREPRRSSAHRGDRCTRRKAKRPGAAWAREDLRLQRLKGLVRIVEFNFHAPIITHKYSV